MKGPSKHSESGWTGHLRALARRLQVFAQVRGSTDIITVSGDRPLSASRPDVAAVIELVTALRHDDGASAVRVLCDYDCTGVHRLALLTALVLADTVDLLDRVTDLDNLGHLAVAVATAERRP